MGEHELDAAIRALRHQIVIDCVVRDAYARDRIIPGSWKQSVRARIRSYIRALRILRAVRTGTHKLVPSWVQPYGDFVHDMCR